MTISEKIIQLRKNKGWSQEDLADRLNISRQSVSKWESGVSLPETEKIIALSEIFDVSCDYLIKDNTETEDFISIKEKDLEEKKSVLLTENQVEEYFSVCRAAYKNIAIGVMLCIFSPILLIFLAGLSETNTPPISENLATALGFSALLVIVAVSVFLFIFYGTKLSKFEYISKQNIQLPDRLKTTLLDELKQVEKQFILKLSVGVSLIILCLIPLIVVACMEQSDLICICALCFFLIGTAIGVYFIVHSSCNYTSYQSLLNMGIYSPDQKQKSKKREALESVYWCVILAIYFTTSFLTSAWHTTWIVWPIAAVLFNVICSVIDLLKK